MKYDEIVDSLAARQHGVVSRQQLVAAGVPAYAVEYRLAAGRLLVAHAGVYAVRAKTPSFQGHLLAAVLAAGPGAVASHQAAAHLHGLDGVDARIEITLPLRGGAAPVGVIVHRTRQTPRPEVVDGIPRTTVARTLIDLAGVLPRSRVATALDDALTRHLVTCTYLRNRLLDLGTRGRPGASLLLALIAERADEQRPLNRFELRLFDVLKAAGIPLPVPQYAVELPGGGRAVLDFAYPDLLIAIEADSYKHHSSKRDWARDRLRNRTLTALGWRVLPVTWDDLDAPGRVLAELRLAHPTLRSPSRRVS